MVTSAFDELDIAIADAVRSAPRASRRELALVLGVDPATVRRRWARMQSEGVAWVTAHLSGGATPTGALVEIDCTPGRSAEVAEILAADMQAANVKLTSGARDVLVLAQAPDLDALSRYLLDRVGRVQGVTHVRSNLVTRSALDASRWHEGALNPEQRRRLHADAGTRPGHDAVLQPADLRIVRALGIDGRMSFERLAEHVGLGPVAVRRRLARLEDARLITFRCDTSRHLSGRPVAAVFFGSLDVHDLDSAEGLIRTLPGVRAINLVAGPHNVIIDARLRTAAEAHDLERKMSQALPALRIQDRSVVLRTIKVLGRILDAEGRSVRSVPLIADDTDSGT
ncbi:DNA-binding Lrp family transcriptional regulator [Thermocatellispora tengchongensis]|uniref:DNA-binding Lrp family transcriptional regulator n=1 Tax=Thermocatellispora tengchongensis TaxID=1073253 RepID=A0A840P852_9ACTN|nr:Lrp/AsnC family transcriptional regulator [Thermocatellispora tengchongensis]MBB5135472.1 DNA-binding Lrp family transcriptional regulator [Thermocatellispora tengchongensis]